MQTAKSTELSQESVVSTLNPEQFQHQQLATVLTIVLEPMLRASIADVMTAAEFSEVSGVSDKAREIGFSFAYLSPLLFLCRHFVAI